jgi:hypothetical protein
MTSAEVLSITMPTLAVLVGIPVNNSRLSDLRSHMDARFESMDQLFIERLRRVEEVVDARLSRIEEHLHLK